jgi:ATP-dependent Clp protease protease subunit
LIENSQNNTQRKRGENNMADRIRYIVFTAGVNAQTAGQLMRALVEATNAGYTEIYLLLSSGGGDVFEGLSLASVIKSLPLKITTHNIGQTDSVANVIFAAGDIRYAVANASFLFHGVAMNPVPHAMIESQLHETYKNCIRFREDIAKNFSAYTGIALNEITELMIDGATILSAEQAQLKGIVHDVRDPGIPAGTQIVGIGNA